MEFFGIRLVGINPENGQKLLLTFLLITVVFLIKKGITLVLSRVYARHETQAIRFWSRQGLNISATVFTILALLSIWFDNPTRLATGLGLVTAGLAFALQKVVTSLAGYIVIMRGNTFSVGERITMGGIRGDVIELNFLQTTIMEMGQPPSIESAADPAMWVRGRQFTGRIVTVTNDKIFENPVYNYTRDFPFIWEEISIPIKYSADRERAEKILKTAVEAHANEYDQLSQPIRDQLARKYGINTDDVVPRVFYRLTDNWLELTVRFIVSEHGVRDIKDRINRDILRAFDAAELEVASATFEVVGLPPLTLRRPRPRIPEPVTPIQRHH